MTPFAFKRAKKEGSKILFKIEINKNLINWNYFIQYNEEFICFDVSFLIHSNSSNSNLIKISSIFQFLPWKTQCINFIKIHFKFQLNYPNLILLLVASVAKRYPYSSEYLKLFLAGSFRMKFVQNANACVARERHDRWNVHSKVGYRVMAC